MKLLSVLFLFVAAVPALGAAHRSDLRSVTGWKFPNSAAEGDAPVGVSVSPAAASPKGFIELLPFALRSPDQEEAGSCLYMSLTGIAEWWLARLDPRAPRTPDGPIDLSERYMMNLAGIDESGNGVTDWKTDSIYLYNESRGGHLNSDYRFTKGWFARDASGDLVKSNEGAPGAEYDTTFNWIDESESLAKTPKVKLPHFAREVLFADPASNQWNTGVMPFGIVEKIKAVLKEKKAPVHIIYNHFGYWHANVILGYDDSFDNKSCAFVQKFIKHMNDDASEQRAKAAKAPSQAERDRLLARAAKFQAASDGASTSLARGGGCHPRGAFFVRDSIYGDDAGPVYDYDKSRKGDEQSYSKTIVMLEYDWVLTMANHATQVTID